MNVNDYKAIDNLVIDKFKNYHRKGKTRDLYDLSSSKMLITATDRISSFDKVFGAVPLKGNILHKITNFWFNYTKDIVTNHIVDSTNENILKVSKFDVYPVEVIVRGYFTGTTDTSLWTLYKNGVKNPYGLTLPKGLNLNDRLPEPVITPTTKAEYAKHDEVLTEKEIISGKFVPDEKWEDIKSYSWDLIRNTSLRLFKRGQAVANNAGLILVDTKYEFGYKNGMIFLIDEIHTTDSSRYLLEEDYKNGTISNYDKEFFRKEIRKSNGVITDEISNELINRYIKIYERISGNKYEFPDLDYHEGIIKNTTRLLEENKW